MPMLPLLLLHLACTCGGKDPTAGSDTGDDGPGADGGAGSVDADGDGYAAATDCDDADPEVHPDAEEVCGDGVDQDCDGVEEGCSGVISAGWGAGVVWGSSDVRWAGHRVATVDGWEEAGATMTLVAAPGATGRGGEEDVGAIFGVLPSRFAERRELSAVAAWRLDGPGVDVAFGFDLRVGDLDADGVPDLIASGVHSIDHPTNTGEVWLIPGPITSEPTLDALGAVQILGGNAWEGLGRGLRYSQDATGDGLPDIVATWTGECEDGGGPGGIYVLRDRLDQSRTVDADDPRYDVPEMCWSDGADLSVLDLDGDGIDDVVFGAELGGSKVSYGPGGYQRDKEGPGYVYLQLGPLTAGGSLEDADAVLVGPSSGSLFGRAVAEGGDLDGDGGPDLLVGAPWAEAAVADSGQAWAVAGAAAVARGISTPDDSAIASFLGDRTQDLMLGYGLSQGGDMDGDGHEEVLVVAQAQENGSSFSQRGKVYAFRGPVAGTLVHGDAWLRVDGEDGGDRLGFYDTHGGSIFGGFDVNSDGFDDFVAGAELYEDDQVGAAYLFYGGVWE